MKKLIFILLIIVNSNLYGMYTFVHRLSRLSAHILKKREVKQKRTLINECFLLLQKKWTSSLRNKIKSVQNKKTIAPTFFDAYGNIHFVVTAKNADNERLIDLFTEFIKENKHNKKGKAFFVNVPHEYGKFNGSLKKAGFSLRYANCERNEWIIRNDAPVPCPATAIAGARAIVIKNEQVLIVEDRHFPGWMGFPGGAVDPYEFPQITACRELKEEVNLETQSRNLQLVGQTIRIKANEYDSSDYSFYFLAHKVFGDIKVQETEILQAIWVPLKEASKLQMLYNLRISPIVRMLLHHILHKGKTESKELVDVRQYRKSKQKQDPKDVMILNLFEMRSKH